MNKKRKDMILGFVIAALNALVINAGNLKEYEKDRVYKLPGQPETPKVSQFSGYITVNEEHGRALFYWFFEAQSQPSSKPLLLWLNGGPGCSSIGYGAAVELGPLRVAKSGSSLEFNPHSWNKESNLLFVESPIGVGFSYTNTSSDYNKIDDGFVAEDAYNFVVNWVQRFPQFKNRDFFISGESYAGHYVPQLAELVYDRNKNTNNLYPFIHLKGFIVGNPEMNDHFDYKGLLEYAWSHSVASDQDYEAARGACDFRNDRWSPECNKAMDVVFNRYKDIDMYNIYAPSCLVNKNASSLADHDIAGEKDQSDTDCGRSAYRSMIMRRRRRLVPGGYDPCHSTYTAKYFNKKDVRNALHVKYSGLKWSVCNDTLFKAYNYIVFSVLPIYKKLIRGGLKIWIYSGDADGRVPIIGTRYCIEAMGLRMKKGWRSWLHNNQVAGRTEEYEQGLRFVSVRGAGHLVPLNKPRQALSLIRAYLSDNNLPTPT